MSAAFVAGYDEVRLSNHETYHTLYRLLTLLTGQDTPSLSASTAPVPDFWYLVVFLGRFVNRRSVRAYKGGPRELSSSHAAMLVVPANGIIRLDKCDIERFTFRFETPHSL